jgi:hypothetical protein
LGDKTDKWFTPTQPQPGNSFNTRKAITEYDKAQEAFRKNYQRLKVERLAREAAKSKDT